jgi:hypothetical protein
MKRQTALKRVHKQATKPNPAYVITMNSIVLGKGIEISKAMNV